MGFLCNHQELIHCHYIIFYWKFYCVFYMCTYLFLGEHWKLVGKLYVETNPLRTKWLEVERGGGYVGTLYCIAV